MEKKKGGRDGTKNLIPMSQRSKEEVRAIAAKGGRNSGKARAAKKSMQEMCKLLLEMPLREGEIENLTCLSGLKSKNITTQQALIIAQLQKALKGDLQSFNAIVDLSGNRVQQIEQTVTVEDSAFFKALEGKAAEVWKDAEKEE